MFRFFAATTAVFSMLSVHAQENSPYSRYGMGDFFQGQHINSRGMGGLGAAYADGTANNNGQTVNFANPAAFSNLYLISYDIGLTYDARILRSNNPSGKFNSNYLVPSYFALGMPLNKKRGLGMAFGLRPLSRINYSIVENGRTAGDSIQRNYSGTGGLNQAFIGLGKKWKGFSIGFNTGINFGRKEIATFVSFVNDSIAYKQSNSSTTSTFSGLFLSGGSQWEFAIKKVNIPRIKTTETYLVRLGVSGTLGNDMKAKQDIVRATVSYNSIGELVGIDTVYNVANQKGNITMPANYAAGITFRKTVLAPRGLFDIWSIGAEYTATKWSQYKYYGQADALNDSWMFKVGAQISPDPVSGRSYWGTVNYRFGFFTGQEGINADGKGLKTTGGSFGLGIPVRKWNTYSNQFTIVNTAIQFGKRGTSANNITESFLRLSFGLSLSDIWFIPRKYD